MNRNSNTSAFGHRRVLLIPVFLVVAFVIFAPAAVGLFQSSRALGQSGISGRASTGILTESPQGQVAVSEVSTKEISFAISFGALEFQTRDFSGGSGTPEDPYQITNVDELQAMKDDLSASYILMNDIDASDTVNWNEGAGFEPIGYVDEENWVEYPFTGSLDGRGYKIENLFINRPTTNYVGLFGYIAGEGEVKNVILEYVDVSGNYDVGGLVGWNEGTVSNCYATGSVSGGDYVGGLVGYNYYEGTVSNCYAAGSVSGDYYYVGGLVGGNTGTVSNCYATGSVSGDYYYVGGLVGGNYGTVYNSYSTGTVSGSSYVGGLVGRNYETVSNSFWDTQTSKQATSAAGTGKTTENMKNVRTYTDNTWSVGLTTPWDFVGNPYDDNGNEDIWNINPAINNGYPFLSFLYPVGVSFTFNLRAGWNMVSFPVMPDNKDPHSIFPGYYAMYRWDAAGQSYVSCTDNPIENGVGYWVNVIADENVVASGTPVDSLTLSLKKGWNLIGSPYGGANIANPDDNPDNSVIPSAYTWTGSGYVSTQQLEAGKGYWVNAMNDCVLKLPGVG